VSLYWLVLYKLQEGVLLLMLPDDQLYNFWVTVVLAMVGQSLGLLQMLYTQIRSAGWVAEGRGPGLVFTMPQAVDTGVLFGTASLTCSVCMSCGIQFDLRHAAAARTDPEVKKIVG